jgi:hypothetical protein
MCTVAEICSTGVRVTLSDVPEVLLTATNSEPQVQDAGLAAKAGDLFDDGIGSSDAVFFCARSNVLDKPGRPAPLSPMMSLMSKRSTT